MPPAPLRLVLALLAVSCVFACVEERDPNDTSSENGDICQCLSAVSLTVVDIETGDRVPNATADPDSGPSCNTGPTGMDPCELGDGEGPYTIEVSAPGYQTQIIDVYVSSTDIPGCPCTHAQLLVNVELLPDGYETGTGTGGDESESETG